MSQDTSKKILNKHIDEAINNGHGPIILAKDKRPVQKNWTDPGYECDTSLISKASMFGLRADQYAFLDLDIYDEEVMDMVFYYAEQELALTPFVRKGTNPKVALIYRCPSQTKFQKVQFRGAQPSSDGKPSQIEFQTASNKYLGVDGTFVDDQDQEHSYSWTMKSLIECPFDDIPEVTVQQLHNFRESVVVTAKARGWMKADVASVAEEDRAFEHYREPHQVPLLELKALLKSVVPLGGDYETWIKVGMALYHETQGDDNGRRLFHAFSEAADGYEGYDEVEAKWETFSSNGGTTIASVFQMAKDLDVDINALNKPEPVRRGMRPMDSAPASPPDWMVREMITPKSSSIWFGDTGTFKSFLALDFILHIASGQKDWHGQAIHKNGPCVYIAGEDEGSIGPRRQAWQNLHKVNAIPDAYIYDRVDLADEQQVQDLSQAIEDMEQEPLVIVVDTLAANFSGDINNDKEVNAITSNLRTCILDKFNAAVIVVAHTGIHDRERVKGSSQIKANSDFEFHIIRPEKPQPEDGLQVTIHNSKSKNSATGFDIPLMLEVVPLGIDQYGEAHTSLSVIPGIPTGFPDDNPIELTGDEEKALSIVADDPGISLAKGGKAVWGITGQSMKFKRLMHSLADKGFVEIETQPGKGSLYSLIDCNKEADFEEE